MAKNIILCTDGTGNAEGRRIGTNVGRIFKAINLSENQVAFYDDGVGTEENKYLRALGGAFGLGLKRNILDLYEFLCRTYRPGDQIYIFGFSRGAYTARAVAGLICACGVIDPEKDGASRGKELRRLAERAYEAYRLERYAPTVRKFLNARGVKNFRERWSHNYDIKIRFIGVWDTVDAVGMPIDEVATAFNLIFQFRFTDSVLSEKVHKGCQAIAIDDQRQTFHPDIWQADETKMKDGRPRIEQVFFAGMHSNVGGGYPKDELSYAPLKWMMAKADANGLRFIDSIREDYEKHVNPNGKIYDSRAGLKLFYRFNPRNIYELAKKAGIQKVQVHESVADRIFNHVVDYGPANMISDFDVVDDHGQLTTQNHCSLKRFEQKKSEKTVQQGDHKISLFQFALTRVADIAWWRRALHVGTIISLIAFTVFPWLPWVSKEPVNCTGFFSCLLEPLLGALLVISAGAAKPWTIALSAHPAYFVGFVGVFAFLVVAHLYLRSMMIEASLQAWKVVTGKKSTDIKKNLFHAIAYHLRRHRISKIIAKGASKWVIPGAFVTLFLLGIAWVSGSLVVSSWTAFGFHQPGCETRSQDQAIIDANNANSASNHCIITGYRILKEQSYLIRIQATNDWVDKTIPASQPSGFTSSKGGAIMHLFAPFRRHVDQPWFQLMAKVGDEGEPFAIDAMDHPFTADASGNLIVYVNDAYCPGCPDPWSFYKNNQGQIIPTVLDEKGEELIKKLK